MTTDNHYPYYMPPTARYHLYMAPIPKPERLDFFYKYKRPEENIYRGMIGKSDIAFEGLGFVFANLTEYLTNDYFNLYAAKESNLKIKLFPKICWLAEEFLKNGFTFKFPVCLHYNPRAKINVMHPGSTRDYVIELFHNRYKIECFYFNTGGVVFDFMKNMQIVPKEDLLMYPKIQMNIAFDHCSAIPHINLDERCISDNVPIWQEKIQKKLNDPNFKIFMDKDIDILSRWKSTEESASVKIYIHNPKDKTDVVRACVLAVIGHPYKSDTLTVIV